MFYVTDNHKVSCEPVMEFPEALEAAVVSMNLRPLKQEQVVFMRWYS